MSVSGLKADGMSMFKSDDQGFLIGEKLLDGAEEVLRLQERAMPVWREIRRDVRGIAQQLGVQTAAVRRVTSAPARAGVLAAAPQGSIGAAAARASARAITRAEPAVVARRTVQAMVARDAATRRALPAAIRTRDASGRFLAASRPASSAAPDAGDVRDARGRFTSRGGADGGSGGRPGAEAGAGGAAAVAALTKAGEGLTRVASAMTGADNLDPTINAVREVKDVVAPVGRGIGWLFGRNSERKKEGWFRRLIKAVKDNKPAAVAGGGPRSGGLLGLLSPGMVGSLLGTVLRGAGGLLRKLPVIGGLFAGGMGLAGALGLNDDPNKTPEENRAMRYRSSGQAGGMGVGALVGGALGSLLGPLGTVGGAWLGSLVGEKVGGAVGDWVKSLVDAKVPARIVEAVTAGWDAVMAGLKSQLGKAKGLVNDAAAGAGTLLTRANEAVRARTGGDVAGGVKAAAQVVGAASATTASVVKENAAKMVPETVKRAAAAAGGALGISKVMEAGPGYNVVQRTDGSVVRQEGARNWRNNNPGNIEFRPWMAERYGATSDGRFAIFPTYEAGRAAQEAMFFEGKGYRNLKLSEAIARWAPPTENNTTAYQAAVLASVTGVDKPTSQYTAAERRAILDAKQRVEGFKVGTVTTMRPATPQMPSMQAANVQGLSVADIPKPVEPREPPQQLNASDTRPQAVKIQLSDSVGQDVRDRSLAHIVTGGLSRD
jgi:hypothetical protein